MRTTASEMGPTLLSNLLELNETQEGVMQIAFSVADDQGLLLLDLRTCVRCSTGSPTTRPSWNASMAESPGQRDRDPAPPAGARGGGRRDLLRRTGDPHDHLMQNDFSGRGVISILDATTLYHSPRIYATFLLWLLSELMENLPERGDADLPRLVFFFDEAHLLFSSAPKALLEKITQVVRLIRSKGSAYSSSPSIPNDVPNEVIGQLGNRIQHALRAFTPAGPQGGQGRGRDVPRESGIRYRGGHRSAGRRRGIDLDAGQKGVPTVVERTLMAPPRSQFGPIDDARRAELIARSPLGSAYETALDRESASRDARQARGRTGTAAAARGRGGRASRRRRAAQTTGARCTRRGKPRRHRRGTGQIGRTRTRQQPRATDRAGSSVRSPAAAEAAGHALRFDIAEQAGAWSANSWVHLRTVPPGIDDPYGVGRGVHAFIAAAYVGALIRRLRLRKLRRQHDCSDDHGDLPIFHLSVPRTVATRQSKIAGVPASRVQAINKPSELPHTLTIGSTRARAYGQ